ncbi:sigma factor-like helix-turn-helix DNA-binding protein [Nocardia otitidiscaviarum]|uniref:sigma factor-like helix-turn-helix DNA-binding protein n=1 Tax=Nocardia otitidiscaviarum TaxID=1823 RepID=UPI0004A7462A|nr:sigma factor-like helix-turn-helix DNA-binding protein [Nocardia otitidiscaviarum]
MARKKSKPVEESLEVQQRRKRALELRLAGKKQYEIAEIMGLHKSTISSYIQDALADVTREKAEEYLELELQRLDAMLAAIWPDIVAGERGAEWKIDRALAIMDQRAKLTGTYKAAELKAIADAKGTVSTETTSMVGTFFRMLETLHEADAASEDRDAA